MNNSTQSKFSCWIFDSFSQNAEGLALYRIFTALFILFFELPSPKFYAFLSDLPSDFFAPPPGPIMLFNGFPAESVFLTLHYLLIVALIFLCFGFATKTASIFTGLLLLVIKGFIYSLGKINHDLLLAVVPLVMAFSGWGRAYAIDAFRNNSSTQQNVENWMFTLLALIIGFMMFTAGFPKILGGWLNVFTHATEGHYLKQFFARGRTDFLAPFALHIPGFLWEVLDYATVLFEVGFLVAIINPKSTRVFICFAVFFHFSTMLILNISFLPNFVAYAAFLNWKKINQIIQNKTAEFTSSQTIKRWLPPVIVGIFMIAIWSLSKILDSFYNLRSDLTMASVIIVCLAVPIAVAGIVNLIRKYYQLEK